MTEGKSVAYVLHLSKVVRQNLSAHSLAAHLHMTLPCELRMFVFSARTKEPEAVTACLTKHWYQ